MVEHQKETEKGFEHACELLAVRESYGGRIFGEEVGDAKDGEGERGRGGNGGMGIYGIGMGMGTKSGGI